MPNAINAHIVPRLRGHTAQCEHESRDRPTESSATKPTTSFTGGLRPSASARKKARSAAPLHSRIALCPSSP